MNNPNWEDGSGFPADWNSEWDRPYNETSVPYQQYKLINP